MLHGTRGPLPNPNNYKTQNIYPTYEPMDLRGTNTMLYRYLDSSEDTVFAFVSMLRRIRRVSATTRSDPYLRSDMCTDDGYGFDGKTSTMKWKLIGEKTLLMPFMTPAKIHADDNPDGSFTIHDPSIKLGYMVPGSKVAPWAPVDAVWAARPVWIVEMEPKNVYYNYGKMILYVDKDGSNAYFKEIYDKAGQYWKTVILAYAFHASPSGKESMETESIWVIDDKSHHATYVSQDQPPPHKKIEDVPMTSHDFTEAALLETTK